MRFNILLIGRKDVIIGIDDRVPDSDKFVQVGSDMVEESIGLLSLLTVDVLNGYRAVTNDSPTQSKDFFAFFVTGIKLRMNGGKNVV